MIPTQLDILRALAKDKDFGRGPRHANQVGRLAIRIYHGLVASGMLNEAEGNENSMIVEAAALLHDVGLPREPHNEIAFDFLARAIPRVLPADPLPGDQVSTVLYCVLWHRGAAFTERGGVAIGDLGYTRKMAAIIRVADALDRTLRQVVEDVSLRADGERLVFGVSSTSSIITELARAREKSDLMKHAYEVAEVSFEHTK
jgi:exopolyphosphatase/guanosine-5'-triphosphate,3'-diphosphate pyrophosphatase